MTNIRPAQEILFQILINFNLCSRLRMFKLFTFLFNFFFVNHRHVSQCSSLLLFRGETEHRNVDVKTFIFLFRLMT